MVGVGHITFSIIMINTDMNFYEIEKCSISLSVTPCIYVFLAHPATR